MKLADIRELYSQCRHELVTRESFADAVEAVREDLGARYGLLNYVEKGDPTWAEMTEASAESLLAAEAYFTGASDQRAISGDQIAIARKQWEFAYRDLDERRTTFIVILGMIAAIQTVLLVYLLLRK